MARWQTSECRSPPKSPRSILSAGSHPPKSMAKAITKSLLGHSIAMLPSKNLLCIRYRTYRRADWQITPIIDPRSRYFPMVGDTAMFLDPDALTEYRDRGFCVFAGIFALTYFSRLTDPLYVWGGISIGLLLLVWGLGRGNWRISLAAIICTIAGAIVPVYGFLLGYRGVMLSIAGLMSILWLVARNWYGWYQLEPRDRVVSENLHDRSVSERLDDEAYVRHDLLEESTTRNRLNPASPSEETERQLRDKGV